MQGTGDMYYYSTTFSGGPGVRHFHLLLLGFVVLCLTNPCTSHLPALSRRTNSGAFDAPKAKCPPDRGSLGCVTDSPASTYASLHSSPTNSPTLSSSSDSTNSSVSSLSDVSSRNSSLYTNSREPSLVYPLTPPLTAADRNNQANIQSFFNHNNTQKEHEQFPRSSVLPQPIINKNASVAYAHNIATPPLTPDDSPFDESSPIKQRDHADALEFLTNLFPTQGVSALQFAKSVSIASAGMNASFDGVVLSLPGKPKTLYVDGKSAEIVSLRERYVVFSFPFSSHFPPRLFRFISALTF